MRNQLVLMVAIPIFGLVYFTLENTLEKLVLADEMRLLQELSDFAVKSSSLVHELQKERGMSAGYIGKPEVNAFAELQAQRRQTDEAIKEYDHFVGGLTLSDNKIQNNITTIFAQFKKIKAKRSTIDHQQLALEDLLSYYNFLNDKLLTNINHASKITSDAQLSEMILAYVNLLRSKENAGIERAILNHMFNNGYFAIGMYNQFISLVEAQNMTLKHFIVFATPSQRKRYHQAWQNSPVVNEVESIRQQIVYHQLKLTLAGDLRAHLGYGGLIHQFNNYVRRGEQKYLDAFHKQYQHVSAALAKFEGLSDISPSDIDNLEIIKKTFEGYQRHLEIVVQLKKENKPIEVIDNLLQINNTSAVEALNHLVSDEHQGVFFTEHLKASSADWWKMATGRIELLKEIEEQVSSDLKELALKLRNNARYHFIFSLILTGSIILFTFFYLKVMSTETTQAYARFVPYEFLRLLNEKSLVDIQLGNHLELEMTVLFSDIRSFTTLSEKMSPLENLNFINAYLDKVGPVIREHQGFIDKYIGDAIMALFLNADDALKASLAMLNKLSEFNQTREEDGLMPIGIGIGLNTGQLMLGIIGEQNRLQCTVISDTVNLASRIESSTKTYKSSLLISQNTYNNLTNPCQYAIRFIDNTQVKGRYERINLYQVFDEESEEIRTGQLTTRSRFEKAVCCYQEYRFGETQQLMQECLAENPWDSVVKIYLQRCDKLLNIDSNENWQEFAKQAKWSPNLSSYSEIDQQHLELFAIIKGLIMNLADGDLKTTVGETIHWLESDVSLHFETEEKYMKQHDDPDYAVHKAQHRQFLERLNNVKQNYQIQPGSLSVALQIKREIFDWLVYHIHEHDKQIGLLIREPEL